MADLFSTNTLTGVVENLAVSRPPRTFLRDRYFPTVQTSNTQEIQFDRMTSKARITPLVSPLVAGKIVESAQYVTDTFRPAYAKDKRRFLPTGVLRRTAGEAIGGDIDPMERRRIQLRTEQEDQLAMLTRREEVMCAEGLRTGKVTIAGEGYTTVIVDFQRDSSLTITLAGAAKWDQANVKVLSNLETWATLVQDTSGAVSTDVVMHPGVWPVIRDRLIEQGADIALTGTLRGGDSEANLGPLGPTLTRSRQVAMLGDFTFYTYNDKYVDDTGSVQDLVPAGTVMLLGGDVEGVRAYGSILDEAAGYTAQRYFAKSWIDNDPPIRWLLLQSAPLMVPTRANATLSAKVF